MRSRHTCLTYVRAFSTKDTAANSIEAEIAELEAQIDKTAHKQASLERQQGSALKQSKGTRVAVSPFEEISDLEEDLTAVPQVKTVRKQTYKQAWRQPRSAAMSAAPSDVSGGVQEGEDKLDANVVQQLEGDTDRINEISSHDQYSADADVDADIRQQILQEVDNELRSVAETLTLQDAKDIAAQRNDTFDEFIGDLSRRARPFTTESALAALGGTEEDDIADEPQAVAQLPAPGLSVDYCVFCYHGTHFLRHDNAALLTKFVSDKGLILPKRFTKCCPKHQRR